MSALTNVRENTYQLLLLDFPSPKLLICGGATSMQTAVDFYHGTVSGQIDSLITIYSFKLLATTDQFAMATTRYSTFAAST